jgi:Nucleotidyl transferase AbiEii toxin, Type IV TA system
LKPHLEVLDAAQAALLRRMGAPMARDGFYLAGGTAVALHLGHRRSVDLDWFTPSALADPMQHAGRMRAEGLALTDVETQRGTLHARLEGVRVTLIEYLYPLLRETEPLGDTGARVAALEDLGAMKLAAVAQRGTRRDFVDVHALARRFQPLGDMLGLYRKKYGVTDVTHVLYGLSYFDDADAEQMPDMLVPADWGVIKADIRGWVKALA